MARSKRARLETTPSWDINIIRRISNHLVFGSGWGVGQVWKTNLHIEDKSELVILHIEIIPGGGVKEKGGEKSEEGEED